MRRSQAEVALVAILEAKQLLPVEIPAAGLTPELGRRGDRHEEFLGACSIHLFSDDALNLSDDAEPKGQVGIDTGRDLPDHPRSQHQAVADGLGLAGILAEGGDQEL